MPQHDLGRAHPDPGLRGEVAKQDKPTAIENEQDAEWSEGGEDENAAVSASDDRQPDCHREVIEGMKWAGGQAQQKERPEEQQMLGGSSRNSTGSRYCQYSSSGRASK
jgi:hypothetical protein